MTEDITEAKTDSIFFYLKKMEQRIDFANLSSARRITLLMSYLYQRNTADSSKNQKKSAFSSKTKGQNSLCNSNWVVLSAADSADDAFFHPI